MAGGRTTRGSSEELLQPRREPGAPEPAPRHGQDDEGEDDERDPQPARPVVRGPDPAVRRRDGQIGAGQRRQEGHVAGRYRFPHRARLFNSAHESNDSGDPAVAKGKGDGLQLRMNAELDEDVVDVIPDGGQAQTEVAGDILVLKTCRHLVKDFGLPRREGRSGRQRPALRSPPDRLDLSHSHALSATNGAMGVPHARGVKRVGYVARACMTCAHPRLRAKDLRRRRGRRSAASLNR